MSQDSAANMPAAQEQAEKRAAAIAAVQAEVRSGMVVGLGTGTTAYYVLEELARRIRDEGLAIRGVPTSSETERLASGWQIPLTDLGEIPDIDIDGADEIDPRRNLTKGAGGALTREKCVAVASRRLVIVAHALKLVKRLAWPVPLEVLPFAEPVVTRELKRLFPGCSPVLRIREGAIFLTDNGNHIVDLALAEPRPTPARLAATLEKITGVVEHGLFVGMNPAVYVAGPGGVRVLGNDS